jgi:ABC-type multidrug transport system fused ATPase/permease subunit
MFFSMRFADDLGALIWQSEEFVRFMNGLTRYYETFDTVKIADDQLVPTEDIAFKNLSFRNVSLQRKERETLQDISFDLPKGQKLAIVGYTGSGKSTMIDITLKAITEFQGDVHLNEKSYKDLKVVDITNIFSVVPQEVQLFRDTVKGNILASNPDFSGSLDTLISTCMLGDLINKLPKGVDTEISEGSTNISGGERQRIGIARALVEQQPILVLDEATASLDPKTERQVITNIIHAYPELTVIYITHKYSLLNYFDHILVLSDGKIIEQGDFDTLVKRGGLFKDLFEASQV